MADEPRSREELIACLAVIAADPNLLGAQGIAVLNEVAKLLHDDGPKVAACEVMATVQRATFEETEAGYRVSLQRRPLWLFYTGDGPLPELAVLDAAAKLDAGAEEG